MPRRKTFDMARYNPIEQENISIHFTEGYEQGYAAGFRAGMQGDPGAIGDGGPKKRKLSAWNKFVKANSKKPRFIYRNGKLNLKKMAVAFRKTPAGKKRKR